MTRSADFCFSVVHQLRACLRPAIAGEEVEDGRLQLLERPALRAILVGVVELLDLRVGHRRQQLCRLLRDVLLDRHAGVLRRLFEQRVGDHLIEDVALILIEQLRDACPLARVGLLPVIVQILGGDLAAGDFRDDRVLILRRRTSRGLTCTMRLAPCDAVSASAHARVVAISSPHRADFISTDYKESPVSQSKTRFARLVGLLARLWLVACTPNDGERRILAEAGVDERPLAQIERRTRRLHDSTVLAHGA